MRLQIKFTAQLVLSCILGSTGLSTASAQEIISARVERVIDGDSLVLAFDNGLIQEARLAGIDAPEWDQAHGAEATMALKRVLRDRRIYVTVLKKDRYDRLIVSARLHCDDCPEAEDIALRQLEEGHAWWYRRYAKEQDRSLREQYRLTEQNARAQRRGLWSATDPVAPWDWRDSYR